MCNNILRPTNQPPPTTTLLATSRIANCTSLRSTSMPFVTVRPTLPQQEYHFRQRPEFYKNGLWYLQVQRNPPALSTSQVSHNHNRREWQCASHARRPGISIHTRGATATNESEKYSRWTCSFCVVAHSKKNGRKKKERSSITFPCLDHLVVPLPRSIQSVYSMHAHSRFFFSFTFLFFFYFF